MAIEPVFWVLIAWGFRRPGTSDSTILSNTKYTSRNFQHIYSLWPREAIRSTLPQWLAGCLMAWRNFDLSSMRYCGIPLRAISQEILNTSILDMGLKFINSTLHLHLSGADELKPFPIPYPFPENESILCQQSGTDDAPLVFGLLEVRVWVQEEHLAQL